MRCNNLLYLAGAALLGIVGADLTIRTRVQRPTLRGAMKLHPGDHEVKCRNHGCQNMGFIPKKSRTSLCPACSKAQGGPQSKFRSTIGKAEAARRMCKRMHQATQEKAVEKHRAIALEHPLALPEERAAYNATLKALIKKPVPEGQAFTHTHLGKSLICLCNCGIIKNCADYPIQVVMVMLFLLGSFNMRIGDVVGVPVETLVRAYYVRTELEKKFPGQVDPWAFVPWGALDKDGYTGFPRYISIECKDSEASKYDKAKKPTHVRRASIMSETDAPLPPALLRPTKDALGIVRHGVVNSRGKVVVAFAVEINGVPDVVELLMWRRQATLRDIEKWTQADFDNFNALLTEESIYDVVDTGMSRKEAVAQVERFYQAYKLAFEAVHAALLARFKGKMPPIKALAGFLNAARYEIPTFRRLRDDAPEDDIAAMGREIENMAKEVVTRAETHRFNRVALDAVDVCACSAPSTRP